MAHRHSADSCCSRKRSALIDYFNIPIGFVPNDEQQIHCGSKSGEAQKVAIRQTAMKKRTSLCHSSSRRETITTAGTSLLLSPSPPSLPPRLSQANTATTITTTTTTTTSTPTLTMDDKLLAPITVDDPNSPDYITDLHSTPTQAQQHQLSNNHNHNHKNKKLFPKKLWDLINDERYNFCLRWSDDGHLVYLNRDDFEDSYLRTPENQFHTQKAISFVRQMNMYGFRKVDDCYYENDNFKRGCEHLLKNMTRKHPNKNQINNNSALNNSTFNNGALNSSTFNNGALSNSTLTNSALNNNELSPNFYRSLPESPNGNEDVNLNLIQYLNAQPFLNHQDGNFNPIQYFNGQPFLNHQSSLDNNCLLILMIMFYQNLSRSMSTGHENKDMEL